MQAQVCERSRLPWALANPTPPWFPRTSTTGLCGRGMMHGPARNMCSKMAAYRGFQKPVRPGYVDIIWCTAMLVIVRQKKHTVVSKG